MEWNISSKIVQVTFVSSFTRTFIFKVKLLSFYLIGEYLGNSVRLRKRYYYRQIGSYL